MKSKKERKIMEENKNRINEIGKFKRNTNINFYQDEQRKNLLKLGQLVKKTPGTSNIIYSKDGFFTTIQE